MRVPFSGRLGIYVITFGFLCDLALHYIWGFEYLYPGIGGLSVLLLPVGILLLLGSAMGAVERTAELDEKPDLVDVGRTATGRATNGLNFVASAGAADCEEWFVAATHHGLGGDRSHRR